MSCGEISSNSGTSQKYLFCVLTNHSISLFFCVSKGKNRSILMWEGGSDSISDGYISRILAKVGRR